MLIKSIPEIPEDLKKYQNDILAGIAAAERRRIELAGAWGYPDRRPAGPAAFAKLRPAFLVGQRQDHQVNLVDRINIKSDAAGPAGLRSVKFWPLMGVSAARHGEGGAWLAYTLAKSLDKSGQGAIPLVDLQAFARDLKINQKTWRRWLAGARRLELVHDRASGNGLLVLASHAMAAVRLGCEYIGTRPASIRAGDLTGTGWRSYVWAAYEVTHGGRQISRAKQEQLTGVPVRTQQAYDNQAGVERRSHYAISEMGADELTGVAEFDHKGAFKFYDKKHPHGVLAYRLPDSRTTDSAESLQRGRSRKISKAIKRLNFQRLNGSSIMGRASSFDAGNGQAFRIFHMTRPQLRATERKLAHMDLQPKELYLHKAAGKHADFWHVIPLGGLAI